MKLRRFPKLGIFPTDMLPARRRRRGDRFTRPKPATAFAHGSIKYRRARRRWIAGNWNKPDRERWAP